MLEVNDAANVPSYARLTLPVSDTVTGFGVISPTSNGLNEYPKTGLFALSNAETDSPVILNVADGDASLLPNWPEGVPRRVILSSLTPPDTKKFGSEPL